MPAKDPSVHTMIYAVDNKPISLLGLGCVTFGREIGANVSFALMNHARANGINFFDTAAAYGAGASERIIGAWLKSNRDAAKTITVATKILPPYTPQNIAAGVEQSLERLQLDTIDLLYLHHWHESVEKAETLNALDGLVRKGTVRRLGVSNFNARQIQTIVARQIESEGSRFQFAQNNHNYAVSDVTDEFYRVCTQLKIEMVGYSPLGAGFLTGKYAAGLPENSRFARVPGHQQVYFREAAHKRLTTLQEAAERTGYGAVQLAFAWALRHKQLASVLIGARRKAHIDQALEALAFRAPDVLRELEA